MGSRFATSVESPMHERVKQAVAAKNQHDTVYSKNFDGIPARYMKTANSVRRTKKPMPFALAAWEATKAAKLVNQSVLKILAGLVLMSLIAFALGGLLRSVHEPDELLPAARELAREIADNTSAMSAALNRQLLWRMMAADHPMEAHIIDSRAIAFMGESEDAKEGVSSFLEKRAPQFKLRPSQDKPPFYPWWEERKFR